MGYHYLPAYNDYQLFLLVTWHHPTSISTHDSSMQKLKIFPSHISTTSPSSKRRESRTRTCTRFAEWQVSEACT